MSRIPEFIESGPPARLIPTVADTSTEGRAASILLAGMACVKPLAQSLLGQLRQKVGTQTKIDCYTEVVFKENPDGQKIRPDGLIILTAGKRRWMALVEAKTGNNLLEENQVARYCQLAKMNGVDAVITISNQFVALPTHNPLNLSRSQIKGTSLFHWSWMSILTEATLLLLEHNFKSHDQAFVLGEMVSYFEHDKSGIISFDRMNPEWKTLVMAVQSNAALNKASQEVVNSIAAWHQEQRDLSLMMSRKVGRHVSIKLSRAHAKDPALWLKEDAQKLVKTNSLTCSLDIPDAAAKLNVCADLSRRTITCSMYLNAPKDMKRGRSRIN